MTKNYSKAYTCGANGYLNITDTITESGYIPISITVRHSGNANISLFGSTINQYGGLEIYIRNLANYEISSNVQFNILFVKASLFKA